MQLHGPRQLASIHLPPMYGWTWTFVKCVRCRMAAIVSSHSIHMAGPFANSTISSQATSAIYLSAVAPASKWSVQQCVEFILSGANFSRKKWKQNKIQTRTQHISFNILLLSHLRTSIGCKSIFTIAVGVENEITLTLLAAIYFSSANSQPSIFLSSLHPQKKWTREEEKNAKTLGVCCVSWSAGAS